MRDMTKIACETATGETIEVPNAFFDTAPGTSVVTYPPPRITVCKDGIVVVYVLRSKDEVGEISFSVTMRDGPLPDGVVPDENAALVLTVTYQMVSIGMIEEKKREHQTPSVTADETKLPQDPH